MHPAVRRELRRLAAGDASDKEARVHLLRTLSLAMKETDGPDVAAMLWAIADVVASGKAGLLTVTRKSSAVGWARHVSKTVRGTRKDRYLKILEKNWPEWSTSAKDQVWMPVFHAYAQKLLDPRHVKGARQRMKKALTSESALTFEDAAEVVLRAGGDPDPFAYLGKRMKRSQIDGA